MNLRLLALAGAVACAVALPWAMASAGQVSEDRHAVAPGAGARTSAHSHPTSPGDASGPGGGHGSGPGDGAASGFPGRSDSDSGSGAGRADAKGGGDGRAGADAAGTDAAGRSAPTGSFPSGSPGSSPASPAAWLLDPGVSTAARCGPELASPEGLEAQTCVLAQGDRTWARTYYRNTTGAPLDAHLSLLGPDGRTVTIRCSLGAGDEPGSCETPREPVRAAPLAYTAVAEYARPGTGPLLLRTGSTTPQQ